MLLSPEIKVAEVPSRAVVVRIDDIFLFIVFFTWLVRMAINKELGLIRRNPINKPILFYIAVSILFTIKGSILGLVEFREGIFYLLKYIEYFMLFFMFSNHIMDMKQCHMFMACFFITAALVGAYGYTQLGGETRITAPFEGEWGEPNTLGGYLILVLSMASGLFLYSTSSKNILSYISLIIFLFIPFLFTYSRASYLSFIPVCVSLIIFTRRKKGMLIIAFITGLIFSPVILPQKVKHRIYTIFHGEVEKRILGFTTHVDLSAAARIEGWRRVLLEEFPRHPLTGKGITGVGLVDSQYPRILGELGSIGFGVFLWMIVVIFKNAMLLFKFTEDNYVRGFCVGYIAGLIGLLTHALGAETFIIVRIMEPFWFLTAILVSVERMEGAVYKM